MEKVGKIWEVSLILVICHDIHLTLKAKGIPLKTTLGPSGFSWISLSGFLWWKHQALKHRGGWLIMVGTRVEWNIKLSDAQTCWNMCLSCDSSNSPTPTATSAAKKAETCERWGSWYPGTFCGWDSGYNQWLTWRIFFLWFWAVWRTCGGIAAIRSFSYRREEVFNHPGNAQKGDKDALQKGLLFWLSLHPQKTNR